MAGGSVQTLKKDPELRLAGQGQSEGTRLHSAAPGKSAREFWDERELGREKFLQRWASRTLAARLRRRAFLVAKATPVVPGRSVLELGAGSGIWTEHLAAALAGKNSVTAAVFNESLACSAISRYLPKTKVVQVEDFDSALPSESIDYVVATDLLTDKSCSAVLELASRCLKPGGQFVFFARNASNPFFYFRKATAGLFTSSSAGTDLFGVSPGTLRFAAELQHFEQVTISLSEVIPPSGSAAGQAIGLIVERAPVVKRFSSCVCLSGVKPGEIAGGEVPHVNLATHRQLFGTVSVVVPCHNEEANIERLVKTLVGMYGDYLHEIVIVEDNSTDRTFEAATAMARVEQRVKVVRRSPPGGVGLALRDGYAAASGKYILSIDCDFITIAPEFQGLFDAVAEGYDGAIGSRFSDESALVRYPFFKILCNRGFHLLLNLLLGTRARDLSNNLKLYRADILKDLDIEEPHFAANIETGLKPLLLNYRIQEVPISWINRTADMGQSSFKLLSVGPHYLGVLLRTTWRSWRGRYRAST